MNTYRARHRRDDPHARVAGVFAESVQPRLVARLTLSWDRVEDRRSFLAGANVEGQDVALDVFFVRAGAALGQRRTDDDDVVGDHRRRAVADSPDRIDWARQIQLFKQIDAVLLPNLRTGTPVLASRATQLESGSNGDDPGVGAIGPIRHTSPTFRGA